MTTMNQFIPPQRKLDQVMSKVNGPAKVDGHSNQTSGKRPNFGDLGSNFELQNRDKVQIGSKVPLLLFMTVHLDASDRPILPACPSSFG